MNGRSDTSDGARVGCVRDVVAVRGYNCGEGATVLVMAGCLWRLARLASCEVAGLRWFLRAK